MTKVQKIEQDVRDLSPEELAEFRGWFLEFAWGSWDRQLEDDIKAGRLDSLSDEALREHAAGKTKPL